jgi:hypothetical protein
MNERIKKLGLEAADWLDDQESVNTVHAMQLYQKKFAELIVRECVDIVASRPYIDDGNWSHPSTMIKQHFGVER